MDKRPFLITAARGLTGWHTVRKFLDRGHAVRAFVHRHNAKADELAALGAEVVVGDFHEPDSLRAAIKVIKRACFCYPFVDRLLEATTNLAILGKEVRLEVTVNMSQIIVREGHARPATRQHWLGDKVLDWAGVGATHIRAGLFADNLLDLAAPTVAAEGKIYLPRGRAKHAPVAAKDIASVIVGILTDPELRHVGKAYVATGATEMPRADTAETISRVVGKPTEHVEIPTEAWLEQIAKAPFMDSHLLKHLEQVAVDRRNGHFAGVTDVIEKIGGRTPRSLETFIQENRVAFGGDSHLWKAATRGR